MANLIRRQILQFDLQLFQMDYMESALPENSLDGETEATSLDSHSQQTDYSNGYEGILEIYISYV